MSEKNNNSLKEHKEQYAEFRRSKQVEQMQSERQRQTLSNLSIAFWMFLLMVLSFVVGQFVFVDRNEVFEFSFDNFIQGDFSTVYVNDNKIFIGSLSGGLMQGDFIGYGKSYLQLGESYLLTIIVKGQFSGYLDVNLNGVSNILSQSDFFAFSYKFVSSDENAGIVNFEFYIGSDDFVSSDLVLTVFTTRLTQNYEVENGDYFISGFQAFYSYITMILEPMTKLDTSSFWAFVGSFFSMVWTHIQTIFVIFWDTIKNIIFWFIP